MKKLITQSIVLLSTAIFGVTVLPSVLSTNNSPLTIQAEAKSSSRIKKYTKAINSDLESEDYGAMTWSWNSKHQAFEATLDPNSNLYQAMDSGQVSIWNAFVDDVKTESKTMKGFDRSHSGFQVINPNDTSKVLLEVYAGKVHYNVGDDIQ